MNFKRKSTDEVGRGGGGMQLTEDNIQRPGFSISDVLIRQC